MFIKITKEAVTKANLYKNNLHKTWLNLNAILSSMLHLHHLVFADFETLELLHSSKNIDQSNMAVLHTIKKYYSDLGSLYAKRHIKVEITGDDKAYCQAGTFYLPIDFDHLNVNQTVLSAENEEDYNFYLNIFNILSPYKMFSAKFQNHSFHGSNVESTILSINRNFSFLLIIVDSDKSYPSAPLGKTGEKAIQTTNNLTNPLIPYSLYILPVKEIENLLPFNIYYELLAQKQFIKAIIECKDREIYKYVDIKDGICTKTSDIKWKKCYKKLLEECKKHSVPENGNGKITGIGDGALKCTAAIFFSQNCVENFHDASFIDNVFGSQRFILEIWEEIANRMFDMGCCMSDFPTNL